VRKPTRGPLCRVNELSACLVWNLYVPPCTCSNEMRSQNSPASAEQVSRALMNADLQNKVKAASYKASPYSAPSCILMLLLAGMMVKFGAAIQLWHIHR
jgi:hypothetical protein